MMGSAFWSRGMLYRLQERPLTDFDPSWWLDALADHRNGWSLGTFGAIAEFVRDPGEPAEMGRDEAVVWVSTDRGAVRLEGSPAVRAVAYETPNRDGETWSHAVALCLPADASAMARRTVLTELGPDGAAIRPGDRGAILFDMGLGVAQADICIRASDPSLLAMLRSAAGRALSEPGNPAMAAIVAAGPHRVFTCRFGRAEVFQPIPPPDGRSPEGPHTHVLPKLLKSGRTHAATTPIPDGLVPCVHLFPPNPLKDQFGRRRDFDPRAHEAFQALLARFGGGPAGELKRTVLKALDERVVPEAFPLPPGRHARATIRVALRQALQTGESREAAQLWSATFDRPAASEQDDDEQPAH